MLINILLISNILNLKHLILSTKNVGLQNFELKNSLSAFFVQTSYLQLRMVIKNIVYLEKHC